MTSRATVTTTMSMRQAVTNEVSVCSLATRWKVLGSEGLGRNPHGAHAHLLTQPGHLCRACGVADAGRAQRDGLEAAGGCGRVRGGQPRKRNVPRKRMMSVFVHVCFMFSYNSQYSEKQGTSATRPTTPPRTTLSEVTGAQPRGKKGLSEQRGQGKLHLQRHGISQKARLKEGSCAAEGGGGEGGGGERAAGARAAEA